jgi:uncharacterized protein YrzB (UPF0473 family)
MDDEKDLFNSTDNEDSDEDLSCISLTDENGNETHFEVLDYFDYNEKEYVVLLPYEDEENDEVIILNVVHSDDDEEFEEYNAIEDEQLLYALFDEFKKRNADQFDFAD